jgi:uncharacterized membrane protein
MSESKKWYASKTIWGIMIAMLGVLITNVLQVPGVELPKDATVDQAQAAIAAIKAAQGNVGLILAQVTTLVGLVIGVIGRIKAEKIIA